VGGNEQEGGRLSSVAPTDRARSNGQIFLNIAKHFFTVRVVRHWNRLSRAAVEILKI